METCTACQGRGVVERMERVGSGDWMQWVTVNETCWQCRGTGKIASRE